MRELGNVMERLVIYHAGRDVEPQDLGLPQSIRASLCPTSLAARRRRRRAGVRRDRGRPSLPTPILRRRGRSGRSAAATLRRDAPVEHARRTSRRRRCRGRAWIVDAVPGALSLELPEGGTTFDELEREILVQVLARADNNQSRAARSLGMSESTFRSRMKRLGLKG